MKFSILVPAYNEEGSIASCLDSLVAIEHPDKEIIVIDDASTDGTARVVQGFFGRGVILVGREKNGGRAAALNSGLQRAGGDVIITTDADTIVPAGWLKRFERQFEQQDVVAVGGAYTAYNKHNPLVFATSILDQILNGLFKKCIIPNKLSGVNSAIQKDVLLSLGGFDESSWWCEDSDLGWKAKALGRVVYDPSNIVSTHYPDNWQGIWKRKFYWGYAMGLKFREQTPLKIKLWLRPLTFAALMISFLLFLSTVPYGRDACLAPAIAFCLLLSSLTALYVPLGLIILVKNKERITLKTLSLLAILPLVREFAYVYGMGLGFCKGRADKITPTWKENKGNKI
ncbi:MAG: glycosyltransferase family 2 protein [Planctomycetes bacterium]|nr:glycosyltransferase family 2 protein [Planctomycetota bacterium]